MSQCWPDIRPISINQGAQDQGQAGGVATDGMSERDLLIRILTRKIDEKMMVFVYRRILQILLLLLLLLLPPTPPPLPPPTPVYM